MPVKGGKCMGDQRQCIDRPPFSFVPFVTSVTVTVLVMEQSSRELRMSREYLHFYDDTVVKHKDEVRGKDHRDEIHPMHQM
jgi:hypothetical protein